MYLLSSTPLRIEFDHDLHFYKISIRAWPISCQQRMANGEISAKDLKIIQINYAANDCQTKIIYFLFPLLH